MKHTTTIASEHTSALSKGLMAAFLAFIAVCALGLSSCDGEAENAGEKIDQKREQAAENAEEAAERREDAAEDRQDAAEEAREANKKVVK